jgi:hypothetical protein
MNTIRAALHVVLIALGVPFWALAMLGMTGVAVFALLADKVIPHATKGNCWSHTLPLFLRRGGYLLIRPADGQRFLGFFPVPHALWVHTLPRYGIGLEQFAPIRRRMARWIPWYAVYFDGTHRRVERPHNAEDDDAAH